MQTVQKAGVYFYLVNLKLNEMECIVNVKYSTILMKCLVGNLPRNYPKFLGCAISRIMERLRQSLENYPKMVNSECFTDNQI